MLTLRGAPGSTNGCGSCCYSQIGWRAHLSKVLSGYIVTHSRTPTNTHGTFFLLADRIRKGGPGSAVGLGRAGRGVEMWTGGGGTGNVCETYLIYHTLF